MTALLSDRIVPHLYTETTPGGPGQFEPISPSPLTGPVGGRQHFGGFR